MHFVTKQKLDRRTFLRGAGAGIALPLLDAMVPAFGNVPGGRTRLVCIEEVHGLPGCNKWGETQYLYAPQATGRDYELVADNPLKTIEAWRNRFTIISNTDVRMAEAFAPGEVGGDHFRSSAVFLTQAHPKQTQGSDLHVGTSLDQLHAARFGQDNLLPSLQLCIEPTDKGGGCDYNYSCAYTDCISWKNESTPLPMIRNPRSAFDLLFGAGGSAEERALRRRTHGSILDWVTAEIAELERELGAVDRQRVGRALGARGVALNDVVELKPHHLPLRQRGAAECEKGRHADHRDHQPNAHRTSPKRRHELHRIRFPAVDVSIRMIQRRLLPAPPRAIGGLTARKCPRTSNASPDMAGRHW